MPIRGPDCLPFDTPALCKLTAALLSPIELMTGGRPIGQCTAAIPMTGTPDAPGRLTSSRRFASCGRLASMYALRAWDETIESVEKNQDWVKNAIKESRLHMLPEQ